MVLLEEFDPGEVLLLVGNCNDWNPNSAARSHVLVQKPGPIQSEVQHEVWVRVGTSEEVEFQIISKKHTWNWRIYPNGFHHMLVCSKPKAVNVGIARGHGAKDAHNRNFLIKASKGSLIVVKVRLGHRPKVWYDLPPSEAAGASVSSPPAALEEGVVATEGGAGPGLAPSAALEHFGRHERLRLVGPFCSWKLEAAGLVFQRRFSAQNATWQEHRLYLQLHAEPIEFQIVSDQLGFKWRLFPKTEERGQLPKSGDQTTPAPEVVVGGENDGHHLNFVIDDEPLSVVAISVWLQVVQPQEDRRGEEGESMEALMRSREHIRARVTYEAVGCSLQEAMQIVLGSSPATTGTASKAEVEPKVLKDAAPSEALDPDDPMEVLGTEDGRKQPYWEGLCPWLHVEDKAWQGEALKAAFPLSEVGGPSASRAAQLKSQLEREGYITIAREELPWAVDVAGVARGVTEIVKTGLPAACILLYDEPWVMAAQLRHLVRAATGGNEPVFDWAAFCVQACSKTGSAPAGWPPHRDRMSDRSAAQGFRPDGSPKYVTFWIALTDATPESSCLMVVPKTHDPGYAQGDARSSPLDTVFSRAERYQHIRPLPTPAGGVVAFSHRLLHWGSAATAGAPAPRVAIAFGAAAPDYERPYLPLSLLPLPAFDLRLSLMAGQVITYSDNEKVITTARRLRLLFDLFDEHAWEFSAEYRQTVTRFNSFKHEQLHGAGIPTFH